MGAGLTALALEAFAVALGALMLVWIGEPLGWFFIGAGLTSTAYRAIDGRRATRERRARDRARRDSIMGRQ